MIAYIPTVLGVELGSDSAQANEADGFVRLTVSVTEGSLETEVHALVSTEAGTATPGTHTHTCTKCTFTSVLCSSPLGTWFINDPYQLFPKQLVLCVACD